MSLNLNRIRQRDRTVCSRMCSLAVEFQCTRTVPFIALKATANASIRFVDRTGTNGAIGPVGRTKCFAWIWYSLVDINVTFDLIRFASSFKICVSMVRFRGAPRITRTMQLCHANVPMCAPSEVAGRPHSRDVIIRSVFVFLCECVISTFTSFIYSHACTYSA